MVHYKTVKIETSESDRDFQNRFRWYKSLHPYVTAEISYLGERKTWFGLGKTKRVYVMSANSEYFHIGLEPFLDGIVEILV